MVKREAKNYGVGIGLRRENSAELLGERPRAIDCLEVAPENYMNSGGRLYRELRALAEQYPVIFHAISLSIGSLHPFKKSFLADLKNFAQEFQSPWMSDHLC
jgi:uncharacterized protein (UPF0276 family)